MNKFGIIGVGNCGGQIAKNVVTKLDADAIVFNTSEQDLAEVSCDRVTTFLLGNKKGAGQNRAVAQRALKDEISKIVSSEDFTGFVDGVDLVYIVSSTGGGTGSGISPVLYKLVTQMTKAPVIIIGVLPTIGEDKGVQQNTANWLNDLYNTIEGSRYMLYDNNKTAGLSSTKMIEAVNDAVAHDIKVLSGFYNTSTRFASIDDEDMLTLLSPAGRIVVASAEDIKEKDLDTTTIEDVIVSDMKTNCHCELDRDNICMNTGLIVNLSDKINETLDMNIPKVHEFTGEPKNTGFKHIHINEESAASNDVFFIASGMSPVNDRITKIADRIHEIEEAEKDLPPATALNSITLKKVEVPDTKKDNGPIDVLSVFDEFGI